MKSIQIVSCVVTMLFVLTSQYCFGGLPNDMNATTKDPVDDSKYAIVVHGGAGFAPDVYPPELNDQRFQAMEQALQIGVEILSNGGSSMEAVESVVVFLEDHPLFNAGKGAVFNQVGGHELDASIMDGQSLACGGIAGVTTIKNPIKLARLVMVETPHVLLVGNGAEAFADRTELERVANEWFDTERTREAWELLNKRQENKGNTREQSLHHLETGSYMGTVGCCALDRAGNLAAATSTGGMTNKKFGRVGDTPIIGAGTYANNRSCAISCTGFGEEFIRHVVAYDIAARMTYKSQSLKEATEEVLSKVLKSGDGGIIGVDREGNVVMEFNSGGMPRAAADSTGRFDVYWHK
ncbi:MAG TPA: isoaspartyl peptidase/L-asparaginase [Pirellulaceae bacterium]|nr:isoaspartyl peptidase/L-asparaginase [Pirellulaceae bacterium]